MRIKAFTIIELIVVLALSASVTTIAYFAYSAIRKTVIQEKGSIQQIEVLNELRFLLNLDFTLNDVWNVNDNTGLFECESLSCNYQFLDDQIIRSKNGQEMIFRFKSVKVDFRYFDREKIMKQVLVSVESTGREYLLQFPLNQGSANRMNTKFEDGY